LGFGGGGGGVEHPNPTTSIRHWKMVSVLSGGLLACGLTKGTRRSRVMYIQQPIPVVVQSTAWIYGRFFAGIEVSNPAGGMDMYL